MNAEFLLTALVQGLAFSALGIGIFLSLRIYNIPDITTDGSYTLGAVITAISLTQNYNPLIAMVFSAIGGWIAGSCSGLIHTRLRVNALLAGILVMTALYSVNLILLGRPNLPIIGNPGILNSIPAASDAMSALYSLLIFACIIVALIYYLLRTDFGIAMRATGNSEAMVRAMGINVKRMKVTGLGLSNACTALSGSLITQYQGFADINMGIGIVISGLGAVMIGETIAGKTMKGNPLYSLLAVIAGCILFRFAIAAALAAGIDPAYLRLMTAVIVLMFLSIGLLRKNAVA